jgi:hypothetical protein
MIIPSTNRRLGDRSTRDVVGEIAQPKSGSIPRPVATCRNGRYFYRTRQDPGRSDGRSCLNFSRFHSAALSRARSGRPSWRAGSVHTAPMPQMLTRCRSMVPEKSYRCALAAGQPPAPAQIDADDTVPRRSSSGPRQIWRRLGDSGLGARRGTSYPGSVREWRLQPPQRWASPHYRVSPHEWPFFSSAIDLKRPMWDSKFSEGTRRKQMPTRPGNQTCPPVRAAHTRAVGGDPGVRVHLPV